MAEVLRGYHGRYAAGTAPGPGRPRGALRRIPRGLPGSLASRRWRALRAAQRAMRAEDALLRGAGAIAMLQAALRAARTRSGRRRGRVGAAADPAQPELPL
ncbi:MAG TPA: hypothetical protein VGR63_15355 [Casimicrobiaceae bacterium]|jgi:hypothetical protein|nr:hypothetical protein [Casimicrobiaceae bacterium]